MNFRMPSTGSWSGLPTNDPIHRVGIFDFVIYLLKPPQPQLHGKDRHREVAVFFKAKYVKWPDGIRN